MTKTMWPVTTRRRYSVTRSSVIRQRAQRSKRRFFAPRQRFGLGSPRSRPVGFRKNHHRRFRRVRGAPYSRTATSRHISSATHRDLETVAASSSTSQVAVPPLMEHMFVISIRPDRAARMMKRLGHWRTNANLLWGTSWKTINVNKWIATGKVIKSLRFRGRKKRLTRGELGCYDSHVRVWKEVVKQNLPYALILEDDAEISLMHAPRMAEISAALQNRDDWDVVILYPINHVHRADPFQTHSALRTRFLPIGHMTGLAGYLISNEGAQKLLKKPFPIACPVDAYVPNMTKTGQLKLFMASPPLGNQVNRGDSDTKR